MFCSRLNVGCPSSYRPRSDLESTHGLPLFCVLDIRVGEEEEEEEEEMLY